MKMQQPTEIFASAPAESGLGALGLNVKSLFFQLITFLLVLILLRRYVFKRLVTTLEKRRQVLMRSLQQAKAAEQGLAQAQTEARKILQSARQTADQLLREAERRATETAAAAEKQGAERAERLLAEAEQRLQRRQQQLSSELRAELAELVVAGTEKILATKLNERRDRELIERSLKELAR